MARLTNGQAVYIPNPAELSVRGIERGTYFDRDGRGERAPKGEVYVKAYGHDFCFKMSRSRVCVTYLEALRAQREALVRRMDLDRSRLEEIDAHVARELEREQEAVHG